MPHPKKTETTMKEKRNRRKPSLQQNQKSCIPMHKADPMQHICFCANALRQRTRKQF
jgi:hypothetical protein